MAVAGDTVGVVSQVITRLERISARIGRDIVVTSGKRSGNVNASAHNSGIAVDCRADGYDTVTMADELVAEGFSAVGEYYKSSGAQWNFAHGDIRGLPGSEGSGDYAPGGSKAGKLCWFAEGDNGSTWSYTWGKRKSGHSCP
jgi:hypothetical protein